VSSTIKRALVTGAAGFIGRHLVARLRQEGTSVTALLLPTDVPDPAWGDDVRVVEGNVCDPDAVQQAMEGCDVVYHLVAIVDDWGPMERFVAVTVGGTQLVLRAAARANARAILTSSIVVYGDKMGTGPCGEDDVLGAPVGAYSQTKQMQERLALDLMEERGLKLTVVRPANVYGPACQPWVHRLGEELLKGMPSIVGTGEQNAGLVYVDNVVDLMVRAAGNDQAIGRIYNACDDSDISWKRYLIDLAALVGARKPRMRIPRWVAQAAAISGEGFCRWAGTQSGPPLTREGLQLIASDHSYPIDRAREELGYAPETFPYEFAMGEIASYLEKHPLR
jgi:nucleoside-diphosphate-sugar epimerase